jgi:hypothetical protein
MEFQTFLIMHKIDIALISETHFTSRTVLKIPHYAVYHIHHPDDTAHGGAAVIVKNSIPHHELVHYQTDKIQAANIRVTAKPWPYCPPRHAISTSEYTAFFQAQGTRFLIGGDWNSKHTEWGARLINLYLRIKEPQEIHEATQYFTTIIQAAGWYSTPSIAEKRNDVSHNVPVSIRELVTRKRQARSRWQRSRNTDDRLTYYRLRRKLHTALTNLRNNTFERYITPLSKEDNTIWKAKKKFKRPQTIIPPIRKADGTWAKSDAEKATTFTEHLKQVFSPLPTINDHEDDVINFLDAPCQMAPPIKPFTPGEIKREIENLNEYKAPGFELITATTLRQLPRKALVLLTIIFSGMVRLSYFPLT